MNPPDPATRCVRPAAARPTTTTPLTPPLQLSAVYRVAGVEHVEALYGGTAAGFLYARDGHPNACQLAAQLADLEAAAAGLVCASGMSAVSALALTVLRGGGHVALSDGLYGKTAALFARELERFGVRHTRFDPGDPASFQHALEPETRLALVETISNPLLRVADLDGLAAVARAAGVLLAVDNTFAPLLCRPLDHGADVVLHSLTKLIGGHSDLTLGFVGGSTEQIAAVAAVAATFGLTGNPFESWLCLRGLATLPVRSERACTTALGLARRLAEHPAVRAVHYPGLPWHPDHQRAATLLNGGFGTIITLDLGGRAEADRFFRMVEQIPFAPSLGDVATTASHPASTSHRGQTAEEWARQGITPGLIRLSIGLEAPEDLWNDLAQALGPHR